MAGLYMRIMTILAATAVLCAATFAYAGDDARKKKCQMADLIIGALAPSQMSAIAGMKNMDLDALRADEPTGRESSSIDRLKSERDDIVLHWQKFYNELVEYSSLMRECIKNKQ